MSEEAMLALAREVVRDLGAQRRIEALPDVELAARGLTLTEIQSIRGGFIDRMMRLGVPLEDWLPTGGCCGV